MRADRRDRRNVDITEFRQAVSRFLRAYARRIEAGPGDIEELGRLVELRAELDGVITGSVRRLHAAGYSWTDVARVLGVTRQAARQRFAELGDQAAS